MVWPWQKDEVLEQDRLLQLVLESVAQVSGSTSAITHDRIRPDSFLGADVGLTSLSVARLVGLLNRRHPRKALPFHTLFLKPDGTVTQDIRVSTLVAFLEQHAREAP